MVTEFYNTRWHFGNYVNKMEHFHSADTDTINIFLQAKERSKTI